MNSPESVDRLVEQSSALGARYRETGDPTALEEAISLARRALGLVPVAGPSYQNIASNLAYRLSGYFEISGDRAALDEAIELAREAVALTPAGHPDRPGRLNNLAVWTAQRGDVRGALEMFRSLLPDQQRVLGPDHPDVARTAHALELVRSAGGTK